MDATSVDAQTLSGLMLDREMVSSCIFTSARCCSNNLVAFNASRSARLGETRVRAAKKAFVQNSSGVMRLFPCS